MDQQIFFTLAQIATSNAGRGGRRIPPWAFTEHGALMAATILNSPRAILMSVYVVRAFVQFRAALGAHPHLAAKLSELEQSLARLDRDTQQKFAEVYEAIRNLAATPAPSTRPIGFTVDID